MTGIGQQLRDGVGSPLWVITTVMGSPIGPFTPYCNITSQGTGVEEGN